MEDEKGEDEDEREENDDEENVLEEGGAGMEGRAMRAARTWEGRYE